MGYKFLRAFSHLGSGPYDVGVIVYCNKNIFLSSELAYVGDINLPKGIGL